MDHGRKRRHDDDHRDRKRRKDDGRRSEFTAPSRDDRRHQREHEVKRERDVEPERDVKTERGVKPESRERGAHNERPDHDKDKPVEKPNFGVSGKLTEDTNTFRGVVIKYNEPPEARKPKRHWRFYIFKGATTLPFLPIHRQSAYLMGRDRRVADIPIDHPSCSKQHAVLQYRMVGYERPDGKKGRQVRPYIIDLNSANGTYINNERIEAQRYVELREKDTLRFGFSSRDYVLLHDNSDNREVEDVN